MKHTQLYNEGYRFYVYFAPGWIEYFVTIEKANERIEEVGHGKIEEVF